MHPRVFTGIRLFFLLSTVVYTIIMNKRDLEFLYEIGTLRNMQRGWGQHITLPTASIAEHMYRVLWTAVILGRMEKADETKIIHMAMAHDLAETRTADLGYIQKVYVQDDEKKAAKDALAGTIIENFYAEYLHEYEARESLEAKIVKDADNLDIDLELRELQGNGFPMPKDWPEFRKMIRDTKLYTESAKQLWDEIQNSDVHHWHVAANKWLKIPDAGT